MAKFLGVHESTAVAWGTGDIGPFTDGKKLRAAIHRLRAEA